MADEKNPQNDPQRDGVMVVRGGLLDPPRRVPVKALPTGAQPQTFLDRIRQVGLTADAVARPAVNLLTFDQADKAEAGAEAFFEPGGLKNLRQRYQAALAQQNSRDRYDAAHRPGATFAGQVVGTGLGLALTDGASGVKGAAPLLRTISRIPGAAKLSGREVAAVVGGGGLAGYGSQAVSDALTGHRSTFGDQGGAVFGGMAGAAALRWDLKGQPP